MINDGGRPFFGEQDPEKSDKALCTSSSSCLLLPLVGSSLFSFLYVPQRGPAALFFALSFAPFQCPKFSTTWHILVGRIQGSKVERWAQKISTISIPGYNALGCAAL